MRSARQPMIYLINIIVFLNNYAVKLSNQLKSKMANSITIKLHSTIGGDRTIIAEPVETDGGAQHNKMYQLFAQAIENKYIGDMTFNQPGLKDWTFNGFGLDDDEERQVAEYIMKHQGS